MHASSTWHTCNLSSFAVVMGAIMLKHFSHFCEKKSMLHDHPANNDCQPLFVGCHYLPLFCLLWQRRPHFIYILYCSYNKWYNVIKKMWYSMQNSLFKTYLSSLHIFLAVLFSESKEECNLQYTQIWISLGVFSFAWFPYYPPFLNSHDLYT